jgi:DNA-directed RNA polymerase subunit F
MTKRETIVTFIKDMLRPRTLREIIDIEMRDATLSKMQAEKSLEYAMSVVEYNKQRIRRLEEKLLEIGDKHE